MPHHEIKHCWQHSKFLFILNNETLFFVDLILDKKKTMNLVVSNKKKYLCCIDITMLKKKSTTPSVSMGCPYTGKGFVYLYFIKCEKLFVM